MKRLHWVPIAIDKVKETIWNNIDEEEVKLDCRQFELSFQFRAPKPKHLLDKKKPKPKTGHRVVCICLVSSLSVSLHSCVFC